MRIFRASLAILVGTATPLPWLLTACGGGDTMHGGPDAGDAAVQDAPADGATSPDVATADMTTADVDAADGGSAADAVHDDAAAVDATVDAAGGGQDAGDASDAEAGVAAIPCEVDAGDAGDGGPSCAGMLTCCGGWCTNTSKDPHNCGSCGNACSLTQFCTGRACDDTIIKNICANPKATVVFDRLPPDDTAGNAIGTALSMGCAPPVTFLAADEDSGVAQDPASGRPFTGAGNMFVVGGGSTGHASVAYMDGNGLTPLIYGTDGTNAWFRNRKTNQNLAFFGNASLTPQHDYFALEVSVEPLSGTLCFFAAGAYGQGTIAAGYFVQSVVVPNRSTYTDAWYVYEWTYGGDAGVPSAADTFRLIAQGM